MQKIFVGDIHGCADELSELLDRAAREFGDEFELWCVGDLVNRGPESLRVLELVRTLGDQGRGFAVLGNHDLALIGAWLGVWEVRPLDTFSDVLASAEVDDWMDWLRARPLSIGGRLESGGKFAMVHASVHPDWNLGELEEHGRRVGCKLAADSRDVAASFIASRRAENSDLDVLGRLTACRSVRADGSWSSEAPRHARNAWHRRWQAREHDYGVVFGHWAAQGLYVADGVRGLDTGCVHHGRGRDGLLTAWLPAPSSTEELHPFSPQDANFWQIPARRSYYAEVRAGVAQLVSD